MSFVVMFKKEIREMISSYKIFIVPVIFVFFGILQPVTMYLLPEILKTTGAQGIVIEILPMTFFDSMSKYFSTILQIGAIVIALSAMGAISKERNSGTAALILSKPVSRASFIFSKFMAYSLLTLLSFFLGALSCWYYTDLLIGKAEYPDLLPGAICLLALLLILLVAMVVLASIIFKSQIAAGVSALISFYMLGILPILGNIWEKATPYALMNRACGLMVGKVENIPIAIWPNLVLIAALMLLAWQIFEHKEL